MRHQLPSSIAIITMTLMAATTGLMGPAKASAPTYPIPRDMVEKCRLLSASGNQQDAQKLRELLELFRQAERYHSDKEDVFLPIFLTHSKKDLLQVLVDDKQGVLDILQFGEREAWFVYQLLDQKPLPEAAPAVARLLRAKLVWQVLPSRNLWSAYFDFVTDNAPHLEPRLLAQIIRDSENIRLVTFAIRRLSDRTDQNLEDSVTQRLGEELLALRGFQRTRSEHAAAWEIIDASLLALDHWQSKSGIDLVVDEIRSHNARPHARDLLLSRVSMPLMCGGQTRGDLAAINEAFVRWWQTYRHEVQWDPASHRWVADRKWLDCGEVLQQGRVVWDGRRQEHLIYDTAIQASAKRWLVKIEKHLPVISVTLLCLLLFALLSRRRRSPAAGACRIEEPADS